jgi:hypothetical protein
MLFQVNKDSGSSFGTGGDATFHSPKDIMLLVIACALLGFGTLSHFTGKPRVPAEWTALVSGCIAAILLFFGGLAAKIVFHRDTRQMEIRWTLFGFELVSHSHPFSSVKLRIRFYQVVLTRGTVSRSRWVYSADVGELRYVLTYPDAIPVSDAQLKVVRKDLGLTEDKDE